MATHLVPTGAVRGGQLGDMGLRLRRRRGPHLRHLPAPRPGGPRVVLRHRAGMGPGYHLRAGCGWDRRPRAGSPDPVGPGRRDRLPRRVDVSRAPGCLENYDGNHYYVSDVGEQLMLATIGTVVVSASVALLVLIVVTLPIIVTRMPADVAGETRLRRISSARTRKVSISDRKSTRLNSSHVAISYAVFCLKKKKEARAHTVATPLQ